MDNDSRMKIEYVPIEKLHPHPRNYRGHPKDQIEHIVESINEHGCYRAVVATRDGTILAGHGVIEAMREIGLSTIPVIFLDIDSESPPALRLVVGDNEIGHLAKNDDYSLSKILMEIGDCGAEALMGTGYDEKMLATLLFVTRPESEIKDIDEAAHWAGLPGFEESEVPIKIIVSFRDEEDRSEFCSRLDLDIEALKKRRSSTWWPLREKEDFSSIRIE